MQHFLHSQYVHFNWIPLKPACLFNIYSFFKKKKKNRCMKMLQQVDGPRWREKLPAVSMANLPSYTAPTTVSPVTTPNDAPPTHPPQATPTSQATPPKTQAPPPTPALSKEELFDKYKSEGNEFVQKVRLQASTCLYSRTVLCQQLAILPCTRFSSQQESRKCFWQISRQN